MHTNWAGRLKVLILVLMALFFAHMVISGQLYYYIGPRFGWLSILAIGMFIIFAATYNLRGKNKHDPEHDHDHDGDDHHDHTATQPGAIGLLLIPAVPLILALLIPAHPLGATAASSRGIALSAPSAASGSALDVEPLSRTVLDWARAMNVSSDPAALNGEPADVIGFVYRDVRFKKDQFMVSRFTITCCVADALALGVVVNSPKAGQLSADSWVRVTGTFAKGELDGKAIPVLVADNITPTQPPQEPYLYP